jgi:drug/metabolite transporter (DMT)-like permease
MSRRALGLFALMSVVWGIPYLLIKVAVRDLSPAMVVEGRTLIGAAILLPLALRQGRIRPLLDVWKPLAAYCVAELAIPWFLLSNAERRIPSSLSGLLVATVPLISAMLAYLYGDRAGLDRTALTGLLVGLGGVAVLLGLDVHGAELGSVAQVLVVAVGYSLGPFITARYLVGQSSLALAAVSLAVVAIAYVPAAVLQAPSRVPPASVIASVVTLGVVCTALAFVAFFELIREIRPTRATLITYFNPLVAVVLGVAVLGESFRASTAIGCALILAGSWFATGRGRRRETGRPATPSGGRRESGEVSAPGLATGAAPRRPSYKRSINWNQ